MVSPTIWYWTGSGDTVEPEGTLDTCNFIEDGLLESRMPPCPMKLNQREDYCCGFCAWHSFCWHWTSTAHLLSWGWNCMDYILWKYGVCKKQNSKIIGNRENESWVERERIFSDISQIQPLLELRRKILSFSTQGHGPVLIFANTIILHGIWQLVVHTCLVLSMKH